MIRIWQQYQLLECLLYLWKYGSALCTYNAHLFPWPRANLERSFFLITLVELPISKNKISSGFFLYWQKKRVLVEGNLRNYFFLSIKCQPMNYKFFILNSNVQLIHKFLVCNYNKGKKIQHIFMKQKKNSEMNFKWTRGSISFPFAMFYLVLTFSYILIRLELWENIFFFFKKIKTLIRFYSL